MEFVPKFEVQKGRTVTCMMGTVHAGGKIIPANFSGPDDEKKGKMIIKLVDDGYLKPVPLTDDEKKAIVEAEKAEKIRAKKEAEATEKAEKLATEKAEAEAEKARKRDAAILEADFDDMNKDPMIQFAKDHEIELKETHAEPIRAELKALQESLTAPE